MFTERRRSEHEAISYDLNESLYHYPPKRERRRVQLLTYLYY